VATQFPFSINQGVGEYPGDAGSTLIFGSSDSHSDFVSPMARFEFFDAFAATTVNAPIIFIRMGGTFQTTLSNGYTETANIFGQPGSASDGLWKTLTKTGTGTMEGLFKQLKGASAAAQGFVSSAGLNGKAQYEFISRRVLNNFQQLIYNGPTFRRFTLPFTMRPTSEAEAKAMIDIINCFRHASSPKGHPGAIPDEFTTGEVGVGQAVISPEEISANADNPSEAAAPTTASANTLSADEVSSLIGTTGSDIYGGYSAAFTFGYPDTCQFRLVLQQGVSGSTTGAVEKISEIFASEYCVIENVSVDYGSQNKMVFFTSTAEGKYYPSEVTLTVNLRETSLPTTGTLANEFTQSTRTIF
jgi:hypothetical protein